MAETDDMCEYPVYILGESWLMFQLHSGGCTND